MAKLNMNAKWVETVKPEAQRKDYFDMHCPGLSLRVTPTGAKTWTLHYRNSAGRLRRLTIGTYPALDLKSARKAGHTKRGEAQNGSDPAAEKKVARAADTFEELTRQYLESPKKKKRTIDEDRRIIDVYLKPFKPLKVSEVRRGDIGAMLQTIAADAPIMANRVLACIRGIFNWAIGAGIIQSTPCVLLKPPGKEKARKRTLADEEIKKVWKALEAAESSTVADTYKLRLLTACRGGEVMGMAWSELDMQERWWTLPEERSKNGLAHRVYLSDPVMRILERRQQDNQNRKQRAGGPSPWVFPGKRKGRPLVEPKRAFKDILEASGVKNWVGHDLRRTAATVMTRDLKITRFIVGRVLNHVEPGVTGKHYDKYEYGAEKQDALERWAKRLMLMVSELKAVELELSAK